VKYCLLKKKRENQLLDRSRLNYSPAVAGEQLQVPLKKLNLNRHFSMSRLNFEPCLRQAQPFLTGFFGFISRKK
jgi:hypothetical protein